jgi:hyperosmotically inducible protein
MNISQNVELIGISLLLVFGLAACDKPGPAEIAGRQIDQTANKAVDNLSVQDAKAGVAIDDAAITAKVKAAIFVEPGLRTLQIKVDTVKGVVTLTGSVDSQKSSNRAKALASAVAGVKKVKNKLIPAHLSSQELFQYMVGANAIGKN